MGGFFSRVNHKMLYAAVGFSGHRIRAEILQQRHSGMNQTYIEGLSRNRVLFQPFGQQSYS